jgi:hypothetical protein
VVSAYEYWVSSGEHGGPVPVDAVRLTRVPMVQFTTFVSAGGDPPSECMSRSEGGTPPPDVVAGTERGLRTGIAVVLVQGVRQRDPGAVVNALVAIWVTYLPAVLERRLSVEFRPWQRLYVAVAMLLHAVGMLGPYDDVWWWDHLTHLQSATLVGGAIHVVSRRSDVDPRPRVLAGVAIMGVCWELLEYAVHVASRRVGLEPILVSYGKRDTLLDLVFNLLGAVIVLAVGDTALENLVRRGEE